jgi:hypothetical protein
MNKGVRAGKGAARTLAIVGVTAATVECVKLALAFIPNVELVTFLIALYAYVFGWLGVATAVVFVCIEPLIYGVGSWVVSYFIYWPLLALCFCILGRLRVKNRIVLTAFAVLMTFLFGVMSSLVDVGLFMGYFDNFFARFAIYYARGAVFYIVQIACNAVVFPLLFIPTANKLKKIISVSGRQ